MKAQTAKTTRSSELLERAIQRRATEAVIWGMPAVNFDLMVQATLKAGAAFNQVVYWARPATWKNQTLTPNPDTIYFMPFINTKDAGPMVIEIPPADDGSITARYLRRSRRGGVMTTAAADLKELLLGCTSTMNDTYGCRLLIESYERYEYHVSIAKKNHRFYRDTHYFLSFVIPIYAAVLTYAISNDALTSGRVRGAAGIVLTVFTIVSSILRPYERCVSAGATLVALSNWKTDLLLELGRLQAETDTGRKVASLYDLVQRKDQEMSAIGLAMMESLIPKSTAEVQKALADKK